MAHCLTCIACFTHPNGIFFAGSLVLAQLYFDRKRFRDVSLVLIAAPYVVAALGWALYASRAPGDFAAQSAANIGWRGGEVFAPWRGIWREIDGRWMTHYWPAASWVGKLKVIGLVLAIGSAGVCLKVRALRISPGCAFLLLLTTLQFLFLSVAATNKATYYMVDIVPFFAALVGIAASYVFAAGSNRVKIATVAAMSAYFVVQGAALWHRAVAVDGYASQYQPTLAFLKSTIQPGDRIIGPSELGYELGFDNSQLVDDVWLGYWSRLQPTVIVIDRWYYQEVMNTAAQLELPAAAHIEELLRDRFVLVRQFDGYQVYRRRGV
jgi:hypothetical protein